MIQQFSISVFRREISVGCLLLFILIVIQKTLNKNLKPLLWIQMSVPCVSFHLMFALHQSAAWHLFTFHTSVPSILLIHLTLYIHLCVYAPFHIIAFPIFSSCGFIPFKKNSLFLSHVTGGEDSEVRERDEIRHDRRKERQHDRNISRAAPDKRCWTHFNAAHVNLCARAVKLPIDGVVCPCWRM